MYTASNLNWSPVYKKMFGLIKKYSILVIVLLVAETILSTSIHFVLNSFNPNSIYNFRNAFLLMGYTINSVYVFIVYKDMKEEEAVNKLILILTFFSGLSGIFLFLLSVAYKSIQKQKPSQDERIY